MNDALESRPSPPRRRGWSLPLGRFLGIDVFVHATFLILLGIVAAAQFFVSGSLAVASLALLTLLAIFMCVLLHEYGHALAARHYGIETRQITLLPIGGIAQLERLPEKPVEQLVVAVAGPAVNLVLAAIGLLVYGAVAVSSPPFAVEVSNALSFLIVANLILFAFNLLPALPMDGGRVLRALLAMRTTPLRATEIAARIGRFMALGFGLFGLFASPILFFIAIFVWFGATQELRLARARYGLQGASVANAMTTDFRVIAPTDRLRDVAEISVRTAQRDFPVVHEGRLVGVLPYSTLKQALAEGGRSSVASVMRPEFDATRPAEALDSVFTRLLGGPHGALPVLDGSRLVGWITRKNLQDFLTLRGATGRPNPAT